MRHSVVLLVHLDTKRPRIVKFCGEAWCRLRRQNHQRAENRGHPDRAADRRVRQRARRGLGLRLGRGLMRVSMDNRQRIAFRLAGELRGIAASPHGVARLTGTAKLGVAWTISGLGGAMLV